MNRNPFSSDWLSADGDERLRPQRGLSYVAGPSDDPLRFITIPALLDEAVSTFEDSQARDLYRMLFAKLPHATVISVGRSAVLADLHRRTFEMSGRARSDLAMAAVPA